MGVGTGGGGAAAGGRLDAQNSPASMPAGAATARSGEAPGNPSMLASPKITADAIVARLSPAERVQLLTQLLQSGASAGTADLASLSLPPSVVPPPGAPSAPLAGQSQRPGTPQGSPSAGAVNAAGALSSPAPLRMPSNVQDGIVAALKGLLLPGDSGVSWRLNIVSMVWSSGRRACGRGSVEGMLCIARSLVFGW